MKRAERIQDGSSNLPASTISTLGLEWINLPFPGCARYRGPNCRDYSSVLNLEMMNKSASVFLTGALLGIDWCG